MAGLSAEQIEQFHSDGFLLVENLFDPETDIAPILAEYEGVLDRLASDLYEQGLIQSTYAELPFSDRLIQIYEESGTVHPQYFDFSLPQNGVTHDTPFWAGPAVFEMIRHPKLLDAIESLIGPEIYSNPVQHIRIKPPESKTFEKLKDHEIAQVGATPWHQDQGVINAEADESTIVTVWFPLRDASERHGCLAVARNSHQEGLVQHCPSVRDNAAGVGVHIRENLIEGREIVPMPMKAGSALFMTKETIHKSLRNTSDEIRISFDLRYNPIGQPTGRESFPGFVARSKVNPQTELHDADIWRQLWIEARRALAEQDTPRFNRWDPNSPACA